ncbi:Uncharacterised protein [Mycobacteroides abscessus subsp. abscessus]|nr:Uncharacterised protein [Mycobacteroides abscessus subsp. abscessus]
MPLGSTMPESASAVSEVSANTLESVSMMALASATPQSLKSGAAAANRMSNAISGAMTSPSALTTGGISWRRTTFGIRSSVVNAARWISSETVRRGGASAVMLVMTSRLRKMLG